MKDDSKKNLVTEEKLDKYIKTTKKALKKAEICVPKKTHFYKIAKDIKKMAKDYLNDSEYFKKQGDYIRSFGAINYAHGWLDSGARQGYFDVDHDNKLFTVD